MAVEAIPFSFNNEEDLLEITKLPAATKEAETPSTKIEKLTSDKPTEVNEEENPSETSIEEDDTEPINILEIYGKGVQEKKPEENKSPETSIDFNQAAEYLIEKGIWEEFESGDGQKVDLTAESFGELMALQAERKVAVREKQVRESFDTTSNQLIDFLNNKGNLNDFLSNYNQTLDIESIAIDNQDGQELAIKTFYEGIGKDKKWIDKFLNSAKDSGDLETEAQDCKARLLEEYNSQREELVKEQEEIAKNERLKAENFKKSLKSVIYADKELVDRDKKKMEDFVFNYKYKDEQGNLYSEAQNRYFEITSDPKKYYKYLRFLESPDSYEDKMITAKEVAKKQYNFLKGDGNSALNGVHGEVIEKKDNTETKKAIPFMFKK